MQQGSTSSQSSAPSVTTKAPRTTYIKTKNNDLLGNDFRITKGDFSHFLGYKAPSTEELEGKSPISGKRVIELELQKSFNVMGKSAMSAAKDWQSIGGAMGKFENMPGRDKDSFKAGATAFKEVFEKNNDLNMRYLEVQYKFQFIHASFGTISNLMKVRHEAVRTSIREAR